MAEAALIKNFHNRYNGSAEYSTHHTGPIAAAS
jgi:hypothetical protein